MAQYLLSVHSPDGGPYATDEEKEQAWADTGVVNDEMRAAGIWIFAGGLHDSSTARVVREKDGALLHTDGPYLEGKEHIGGFWIIDVPDADTAMAWADKATVACRGSVEVRPFQ
jgi:hypothetical protein